MTLVNAKDQGSGRLLYLDGWRAVAIAGVLCAHFLTSKGLNSGRLGVELFFVLSGRLMAQILFIEKTALESFYYRRFTRVWPTLFVFVIALTLVSALFHINGPNLTNVLSALTYTYNYVALVGGHNPFIDHIWSLCIEEHTYIFLGLVSLIDRKLAKFTLPVLALTILANFLDGAVSTLAFNQNYYEVFWRTDVRMSSILLGAALFLANRRGHLRLSGAWPLTFFAFGVVLNGNFAPDIVKYNLGTLCLALAVANIDADMGAAKRSLSSPAAAAVGLTSYSLYLWQQPFSVIDADSQAGAIGLLFSAIACGTLSYFVVENPLRRWLNAHPPAWARPARKPLASPSPAEAIGWRA